MLWCLSIQKWVLALTQRIAAGTLGHNHMVSFPRVYHTLLNKVAGGDVACQVGKAYNICPKHLGLYQRPGCYNEVVTIL